MKKLKYCAQILKFCVLKVSPYTKIENKISNLNAIIFLSPVIVSWNCTSVWTLPQEMGKWVSTCFQYCPAVIDLLMKLDVLFNRIIYYLLKSFIIHFVFSLKKCKLFFLPYMYCLINFVYLVVISIVVITSLMWYLENNLSY